MTTPFNHMGDTPRTDAVRDGLNYGPIRGSDDAITPEEAAYDALVYLCRDMERELNAMEGYPGIVHEFETLKREHEALRKRYAKLHDDHYGTPCEQIRKLEQRLEGRERAKIEVDDIGAAAWDNDNYEFDK